MRKALPVFFYPVSFLRAQNIQHINPPGLSNSPAYTQAVAAKPGIIIWISGQTAQTPKARWWGRATKGLALGKPNLGDTSLACQKLSFLFRGVQRGYFSFQRERSEIMKADELLISAKGFQ
jgi:hypothetical protein